MLYKPHVAKERGYKVDVQEETAASSGDQPAEVVVVDIKALLASANASNGEKLITRCSSCHNHDKNGPNRVGPELWNVVNRDKASSPGFSYSDAMKAKGGKWDYESLYHFINNPKAFVPGTKMSFVGLKKPQDVADLIAFLRTLSDNPAELPK
jgi:cytochrome c